MKKRLLALLCVGAPLLITARLAQPAPDPQPVHARTGAVIPRLAGAVAPMAGAFPSARISAVFLSHACGACRAVVADLAARHARPAHGQAIVFITDSAWTELNALIGPAVRTLHGNPSYARAVGLRVTPTLIELDRSGIVVTAVEIGVPAVRARFTTP